MSWFPEREATNGSWLRRLCAKVLKCGPIPKHVAIIMDGNRRFAVKKSMDRAEGHLKGFDKLAETLEWCLDLGITEVTVYAFSIENFKRSKDEVDCLMELARQKFARLMEEKPMLEKHGVCIQVLGNIAMLPLDVQHIIAQAVDFTRNNTRARLNVCFAYTSRDEICMAMREVAEGVHTGLIKHSDISDDLIQSCLYTTCSPPPDLMIRTSGEVRLSDFLLWQTAFSVLAFVQVLWPEFNIWHLYATVLHYQRNYKAVQEAESHYKSDIAQLQLQSDFECVHAELNDKNIDVSADKTSLQEKVKQYTQQRHERTTAFLQHIQSKRNNFFRNLVIENSSTSSTKL